MKKTILVILVLIIAIGVYYYLKRNTPDTSGTRQIEKTEGTADILDWKLYNKEEFRMQFPPDYSFIYSFCLKDCASDLIEGSSNLYVRVDKEKEDGITCHYNLCNKPAESSQKFKDVTWEYLGFNSYSDVGQTENFYVYRTTREGYRYYISFNEDTPLNETMVSTFRF